MKEKILNNLSLKIISVVVAFVIWLFVANENDPIITKLYTVKVSVTNDSYLDELNKTYQIPDNERNVVVYLKGKKSVVSNRTDLEVEADLTQIVDLSSDPTYAPVKLKAVPGISMNDVTIIPQTIPVYIEEVAEKDFMITVNTSGTPGTGFAVGEAVATPEMVTIQGPDSIVNTIKSVVTTVDVTGMVKDRDVKEHLTIIDQDGQKLTSDAMSLLRIFGLDEDQLVDVSVTLWTVVDDIKIEAGYVGEPTDGYQADKIVTTPETVSVACSEEALKLLRENNNTITIPDDMINIQGADKDVVTTIKLSTVLKEEDGFKIPADLTQSVYVSVNILPFGSREYAIDPADITIEGLASNLRLSYVQSNMSVRVKANNYYLGLLEQTPSKMKISLDLTGMEAGQYTIPLKVVLPSMYTLVQEERVVVLLSETTAAS